MENIKAGQNNIVKEMRELEDLLEKLKKSKPSRYYESAIVDIKRSINDYSTRIKNLLNE